MPFRRYSSLKKYSTRKRSLVRGYKKRFSRAAFSGFRGLKVGKVRFGKAYTLNDVRHAGTSKVHDVEHEEVIQGIDGNAIFNLEVNGLINPTNNAMFPWLAPIANSFQCHRWKKLEFTFVTFCGDALSAATNTLGTCAMAVEYNANSYNTPTAISQIENIDGSVSAKPSRSFTMKVDTRHPLLVHDWLYNAFYQPSPPDVSYPGGISRDFRQVAIGALLFGTEGMQTNALVGELRVRYKISLLRPIPAPQQTPEGLVAPPGTLPVSQRHRALFMGGTGPPSGLSLQNYAVQCPGGARIPTSGSPSIPETNVQINASNLAIYQPTDISHALQPVSFIHAFDPLAGGTNTLGMSAEAPFGTFVRTLIDEVSSLANSIGNGISDALTFGTRDTNDAPPNQGGFDCVTLGPRKDGLRWIINYAYFCETSGNGVPGDSTTAAFAPMGVDTSTNVIGTTQDTPHWDNGNDISPCFDKIGTTVPAALGGFVPTANGNICGMSPAMSSPPRGISPGLQLGLAVGNAPAGAPFEWSGANMELFPNRAGQYGSYLNSGYCVLYTGTIEQNDVSLPMTFFAPCRNQPSTNNGSTTFGLPPGGSSGGGVPNLCQLMLEDITTVVGSSPGWNYDQFPTAPVPVAGVAP